MRRPKLWPSLPLLAKELVEQANRRRTYVVRVIYAGVLFTVFCVFSYGDFQLTHGGHVLLGHGREMFVRLVGLQFLGVLLFLPAMMSGVITYEKERASLALLLLTDLRPREVLWQKYLGRLVPMFTFLLLSLPPLAICYAFGGITTDHLASGIMALFLACFQVGALALMCSAFCRTSLGAFLASYLVAAAFYGLVPLLFGGDFDDPGGLALLFLPLSVFAAGAQDGFAAALLRSIPTVFTILFFLGLARVFLVTRAFVPARHTFLRAFRRLDEFFTEVNKRFGSIVLVRDEPTLPEDEPIAWREVSKRSLGRLRYLLRVVLLLEVPILVVAAAIVFQGPWRPSLGAFSALLYLVWTLAVLAVVVTSANAIAAERTHQTLDVLLTTPITSREILRQKLRGVHRLIVVLLLPFLSIFVVRAWWEYGAVRQYSPRWATGEGWGDYLFFSVLSAVIYLPLLSWVSLWIGLRSRSRSRAILTALLTVVLWCAGPPLVLHLLEDGLRLDISVEWVFSLLSPAMAVATLEHGLSHEFFGLRRPFLLLSVNYAFYAVLCLACRAWCLRNADRMLGRARPWNGPARRRPARAAPVAVLAVVLGLWAAPGRAAALEVSQWRWGFDGRAMPQRVNLLSVELHNPSAEPWEGTLRLTASRGFGHVGAPLVVPAFFLSSGARKWVQFFPYVRDEGERWILAWGRRAADQADIGAPSLGPPARVLLRDPNELFAGKAGLRTFREDLFPTTVAATEGLHSMVLDHVPRWTSPARREAFVDWLRGGGHVHLLHDRAGRFPVFAGDLAVLNAPGERVRVGAGLVVRHPLSRAAMSEEALAQRGYPSPRLEEPERPVLYDVDGTLLHELREMVRPEHNWGLIYFITLVYIVLVGPVNYLVGRRRRGYRVPLAFFLLTVAVVAYLLSLVGRRGHGEVAAVHSVAVARQVEADLYDVTHWVNAFATSGATYTITHDSAHNLYATCETVESVPGRIESGRNGRFHAEIPLYSSRPFLHRAKLKGPPIRLRVARWRADPTLRELILEPQPGFPLDFLEAWAVHGGTCYPVALRDGQLHARAGSGIALEDLVPQHPFAGNAPLAQELETDMPEEARFRPFIRLLVARAVGGTDAFPYRVVRPSGRDGVELFVFARSPSSFRIRSPYFGKRVGYVLYHVSVFQPEAPDE